MSNWLPKRKKDIRRSAIKKKPRPKDETLRIYGPPERRAWVKSLSCVLCGYHRPQQMHQHHIVTGGTGRKADYDKIVPLCTACHSAYHAGQTDCPKEAWQHFAATTEARWKAHLRSAHPAQSRESDT